MVAVPDASIHAVKAKRLWLAGKISDDEMSAAEFAAQEVAAEAADRATKDDDWDAADNAVTASAASAAAWAASRAVGDAGC